MRTTTEGPGGASQVTKTTTYESRSASSYVVDDTTPSYRPAIAPRTYVIQRTSIGGLGASAGGGVSRSMERSAQFGALGAGAPAGMLHTPTLHLAPFYLCIDNSRVTVCLSV